MLEPLTLEADDGTKLEAEVALPEAPRAGVVLCHPHPQFGGTMRSIVVSALFGELPAAGVACLRFNFRGVEGSGGAYTEGDLERLDARAALTELTDRLPAGTPVVLGGWSFGADMALSLPDGAHQAWMAVAPPLRFGRDLDATASDERPKLVVLGEHDQYRPPGEVADIVGSWTRATVEVVGGADHYFVGRTDRLVALALDFIKTL